MSRKNVAVVMGTRPEVIKLASVVDALREHSACKVVLINTGQHHQMVSQALETFTLEPHEDLALMQENQTLAGFSSKAIRVLDSLYAKLKPDLVTVQGDTTTAMVAALCAFYRKIPIAHVEAGLRTFNIFHPFPEEVNRRIITAVTTLHFCPTACARDHILREGISEEHIFVTGNTVVDALHRVRKTDYQFKTPALNDLNYTKRIITVTVHRRENHGAPLREICLALRDIVDLFSDVEIVYPVHLNPNVDQVVRNLLQGSTAIHLLPPIPYEDQVNLMAKSYFLLTDSGGLQEEGPSLGKPVLVLRKTTERPEVVESGHARLIGTARHKIVAEASQLLNDPTAYGQMARCSVLYGDGHAGERIARSIMEFLQVSKVVQSRHADRLAAY